MMDWNAVEAPRGEYQALGSICGLTAISAAPEGLRVLGLSRLSGGIPMAPTATSSLTAFGPECFTGPEPCRPIRLSSIAGLASPAWSRDGGTFFAVGGDRRSNPAILFRYRWDETVAPRQPVDGARFDPTPFRLHFDGAVDWPLSEAGAAAIEAGARTRQGGRLRPLAASWTSGRPTGQLWFDVEGQGLWAVDADGRARRTALTMANVLTPRLALDDRARMRVSDSGSLDGGPGALPGATGVVDAGSGRIVGTFRGRTLSMTAAAGVDLRSVNAVLNRQTTFYIAAVQYVPASRALFVLLKDALDGSKLMLFRPGRAAEAVSMSCGGLRDNAVTPAIRMVDWGTPRRPLPVWLYSAGPSRRLVIFFHGGPGGQGLGKTLPPLARVYLRSGSALARVEYSGGKGAGLPLSQRLAREGFAAIRRDAAAIRARERQLRRTYDEIGVHAESYGAMYGVGLALDRGPDFAVFIAPWLRYRDPAEWLGPEAREARIAYQRDYEKTIFGWATPGDLARWRRSQSDLLSAWTPAPSTLVILGDRDRQVPPDLVRTDLGDRGATIVVLSGVGHDGISGFDETTTRLERFLQGR